MPNTTSKPKIKLIRIVCLADSRKISGRCIAGKEVTSKSWFRPVSDRIHEEISEEERRFKDGNMPALLDVLTIAVIGANPNSFQTENILIDDKYYWQKVGDYSKSDLSKIIDKPETLWKNGDSSYYGENDRVLSNDMAGKTGSLYLITPSSLEIRVREEGREFGNGKRRVRVKFGYRKTTYTLSVTDPLVEKQFWLKRTEYTR